MIVEKILQHLQKQKVTNFMELKSESSFKQQILNYDIKSQNISKCDINLKMNL